MENKGPFINELPQTGEVTLLAVVLDKDLRPKRNGGTFLALRFADRSGELDGKVWDNPETVSQSFERINSCLRNRPDRRDSTAPNPDGDQPTGLDPLAELAFLDQAADRPRDVGYAGLGERLADAGDRGK